MGLVLTVTAGLVVWVVLWALGSKGFDAFMLAAVIILVGACVKILANYLPGRRT
jgi:lipoprotein signal peptidase